MMNLFGGPFTMEKQLDIDVKARLSEGLSVLADIAKSTREARRTAAGKSGVRSPTAAARGGKVQEVSEQEPMR